MSEFKAVEEASKPTRDQLRAKLFSKQQFESRIITIFDVEMEVRQPSLRDILAFKESGDPEKEFMQTLINYCYVPGTNERVFEDADAESIKNWPVNAELKKLQDAIAEMTGIEDAQVVEAEKN